MSMTQIWMLCFVLAMVFFIILSFVWDKMGQKERERMAEQEYHNTGS